MTRTALALAVIFFLVGLALLDDYGPTWDCVQGEYPYGERLLGYLETGDDDFLNLSKTEPRPKRREPHPNFDGDRFPWYQAFPFAATLSAVSCRLLWTEFDVLPPLAAHHVVVLLFATITVFLASRAAGHASGIVAGIATAAFLVFHPRFFAHAFNNLKDVPETALYLASTLAGARAVLASRPAPKTNRAYRLWILTGALTALAFAQKANALFVPIQLMAFYLVLATWRRLRRETPPRWNGHGLAAATATFVVIYFAVSPEYWNAPVEGLRLHMKYILRSGNAFFRAGPPKITELHGLKHVLWTTPLPLLGFAAVGVFAPRVRSEVRVFWLLGVAVPLLRTLLPGMRNFDGIRHFLEFVPAVCVFAGIGLMTVADGVRRVTRTSGRGHQLVVAFVLVVAVAPSAWSTIRLHPHGIAYYNVTIGGLAGAQSRGIADATDYWGSAYWQGLERIGELAGGGVEGKGAERRRRARAEGTGMGTEKDTVARAGTVIAPVASHVADAAAPIRLPSNVRFVHDPRETLTAPLFVTYVTRRSWYRLVVHYLELTAKPIDEIRVQGAPILRTFRIDDADTVRAVSNLWRLERRTSPVVGLGRYVKANPPSLIFLLTDKSSDFRDVMNRWAKTLPLEHRDEARRVAGM